MCVQFEQQAASVPEEELASDDSGARSDEAPGLEEAARRGFAKAKKNMQKVSWAAVDARLAHAVLKAR